MANTSRNRRSMLCRGRTYVQRTSEKGVAPVAPSYAVGTQRLPGDPLGVSSLTVDGFLPGSEVRLFNASGVELPGGVESAASSQMVFQFNFYTQPVQGYLVILNPGYRLLRIPLQLYKSPLSYTVLPSIDPSYIP